MLGPAGIWMIAAVFVVGLATVGCTKEPEANPKNPQVLLKTSKGDIRVELLRDKAPITVENFLAYVKSDFYDGTVFHRVIPSFMIQGGGFTPEMEQKPTREPIKNEAENGLENDVGTLAMARTSVVDSATAQFFINVKDNDFLNHRDASPQGFGYAVFGRVVAGMDVVREIEKTPTTTKARLENVPVEPVVIESAEIVGAEG